MANTFGQLFRVTTFGESHGGGIGVVIDGCPPRLELNENDIQSALDRRRPGQSKIVTQRAEEDRCQILSGVFEGKTLGTPIAILVRNKDARPEDYVDLKKKFRPSHADFTYEAKYGIRNWQGGGRASARETIGRVAAGAIARKILSLLFPGFELVAYTAQIHEIVAKIDREKVKTKDVDANIVRCPDAAAARKMVSLIEKTRADGDSLGGVIECLVRNTPAGLGEPVFDKLEADLAKAMLSLPATKGFEIGPVFLRRECAARNTTTHLKCAAERFIHRQIIPAASKAEFPTAKKFIFESRLNRRRRLRANKRPFPQDDKKQNSRYAGVMIRVFCRGQYRWSKR